MSYTENYQKWLDFAELPAYLRDELVAMDEKTKEDAFYTNLEFGTAGMRGLIGAGTNRINIYVVRQATEGLAQLIDSKGEEAKKRGLFNLKSTPDALPQWIADKNIELFTKYHIFTKEEIESRYEIWLESYSKILNIESNTMVEMVQKDFLPSVFAYIDKVAATAVAKKSVVSDVSTASEGKLIKELSQLADEISTGLETLKADTAKAFATEDPLANAKA